MNYHQSMLSSYYLSIYFCEDLTFVPDWCELNPTPVRGNDFMPVAGTNDALPVETSVGNKKQEVGAGHNKVLCLHSHIVRLHSLQLKNENATKLIHYKNNV